MAVRLFVGNVAHEATEAEIKSLFSAGAPPSSVRVPTDRETGAPRGFAFVEFSEPSDAANAIRNLDRQVFKGRPLSVSEARPRAPGGADGRVEAAHSGTGAFPTNSPGREGAPPRRNFGPDALPRGKRKPERRGENREGTKKASAKSETRRPEFTEEEGPDDFALWKEADLDGKD